MNTREIATDYRLSYWSQIIQERIDSGLSIRAFCENAGIHENTYFYWQRKLREVACEELVEGVTKLLPSGFSEVKLAERSSLPTSAAISQTQISIETVDLRLTASAEYPVDKLALLLRELRLPC